MSSPSSVLHYNRHNTFRESPNLQPRVENHHPAVSPSQTILIPHFYGENIYQNSTTPSPRQSSESPHSTHLQLPFSSHFHYNRIGIPTHCPTTAPFSHPQHLSDNTTVPPSSALQKSTYRRNNRPSAHLATPLHLLAQMLLLLQHSRCFRLIFLITE